MPTDAADLAPLPDEFWSVVDHGLERIGLALTPPQRAAVDAHVRLLRAWNSAINLTALRSPDQMALGHVLDSLLPVPNLRSLLRSARTTVMDIGSGGGFPGMPLAVVLPGARAALVDSIGKKARFLEGAVAAVATAMANAGGESPQMVALAERAEDLADEPDHREGWDLVVSRAVGSVADVAEISLPLTARGGFAAMWKRDTGDGALRDEIRGAARVCQAVGGGPPRLIALEDADMLGLAGHCLVVVEKLQPTPDRYPRPAGERRRA